jgi:ATP-binding cassette, subfamily F, member 3
VTQLSLAGVGVQYGATVVLKDVTFTVAAGDRWGVVGRNGSGKTSLFRLITGEQAPSSGQLARTPGLRISVLDQHRHFPGVTTVWHAVATAFREVIDLEADLARQTEAMGSGQTITEEQLARYSRDLEHFEHLGGYRYASLVDEVLEGLGFDPSGAKVQALAHLSGGERGRVALARQLVLPADVLLLDEPTNHLDLETSRWLEEYLRSSRETQLIISHDRAFLERVVDHVLHVENLSAEAYAGGYAAFVRQRSERRLAQQRAFAGQQRSISKEEDYIRRNIAGQNTRQAKGRRKRLERLPRLSPPPGDDATMVVRFESRERGGDQVVVCERVRVEVGSRVLLDDFTGWIRRGDVVGLIGPNGTGKSTLLRAITTEAPSRGVARTGGGVTTAVYSQDFANVPRDRTIYDTIADLRPTWERGQIMRHLGRVQFSGDEVKRSAASLSGGELARVALAIMMLSDANLLIFDEPTNHLDVESIEQLEDAIELFEGTVLLVSHDRELLRKLVTRVWDLRDARMQVFDGEFAEWEERAERDKEAAAAAASADAEVARAKERVKAARQASATGADSNRWRNRRRDVERWEAQVGELEAHVAELTFQLGDSALYEAADGRERAAALAIDLEEARARLSDAMAGWERAVQEAELEEPPAGGKGR